MSWIQAAGTIVSGGNSGGAVSNLMAYGANQIIATEIPEADESFEMFRQRFIGKDRLKQLQRAKGRDYNPDTSPFQIYAQTPSGRMTLNKELLAQPLSIWEAAYAARTTIPDDATIMSLWNRTVITDELAEWWLTRRYDGNKAFVDAIGQLRLQIPGPPDLVRFAVRDCFTPEIVEKYGYAKETPENIKPYMAAQGLAGKIDIAIPASATNQDGEPIRGDASWFDLYWWSHWELPSLTDGYNMLHRLYSDSRWGPSPDADENTYFDPPDLELLQKTQDIPDYWRKRLQAISYHPLTRADAENCYILGIVDEMSLYHSLRSEGYNDDMAQLLVGKTKLLQDRNLGIDPSKVTKEWICSHYQDGVIADEDAVNMLTKNGFTQSQAYGFLDNCKLEFSGKQAKERLRHIREAYMMGVYDDAKVMQVLVDQGITPFIRNRTTETWKSIRDVKTKFASARQLLQFAENGVLTEQDLTGRLYNLGYEAKSITTMVNNVKVKLAHKFADAQIQQAKAIAAQAKALAQKQLADQRAATQAAKQTKRIQDSIVEKRIKSIVKGASDAHIKQWFKDNLILLWEVLYKLYYKDYTITDAKRYVTELKPKPTGAQYAAAQAKALKQYYGEGNPPIIP